MISAAEYSELANAIRILSVDAVQKANSGHPGMPLGFADVATVLFHKHLKFSPKNPHWSDRDRFVLSAGHGSMLLYSILHLANYDVSIEDIKKFREIHSKTAGHPEYGELPGIEATTGPLGQGVAMAVGMALAEKIQNKRFGNELINHHTFVVAGDGCLMEGISQEAISFAAHNALNKLILLFDNNGITIDGRTDISTSENQSERFRVCGWNVIEIDGHDYHAIDTAIEAAKKSSEKPTFISCKTIIGKGSPNKSNSSSSHGAALGEEEILLVRKELNWDSPAFVIPESISKKWKNCSDQWVEELENWKKRLDSHPQKETFLSSLETQVIDSKRLRDLQHLFQKENASHATRKSSHIVLEEITKENDTIIGGSSDLTGSNLTKTSSQRALSVKGDGEYIHYGIREHAMGAIMNGISLHKGFVPYGGTFLTFSDYCKPAIRLSALMNQKVVYVFSHDSIGLGEDGPTHQPVEHLTALRVIPNFVVFRPCDAIEASEVWEIAISKHNGPSAICTSRQGTPLLRTPSEENLSEKGGYLIFNNHETPDYILVGTGTEVNILVEVSRKLEEQGKTSNVVSMPSQELFKAQSSEYKKNYFHHHLQKSLSKQVVECLGTGFFPKKITFLE